MSDQPVQVFAVKSVEAAVWMKPDSGGDRKRFEITVARCYRDGDTWRRSQRFYPEDLPRLRLVVEEAYRYVALRTIEPRRAGAGAGAGDPTQCEPRVTRGAG